MRIRWMLRMAAAQREVWTGTELRRLLAERAGLQLSSASVSALFSKEPSQIKLSTLLALCTALDCTPNDLITVTVVDHRVAKTASGRIKSGQGDSVPVSRTRIRRPGNPESPPQR